MIVFFLFLIFFFMFYFKINYEIILNRENVSLLDLIFFFFFSSYSHHDRQNNREQSMRNEAFATQAKRLIVHILFLDFFLSQFVPQHRANTSSRINFQSTWHTQRTTSQPQISLALHWVKEHQ